MATQLPLLTRVAVIGSGNWGTAVARIIGQNVKRHPCFDDNVKIYVFPEQHNGKDLGTLMNENHENPKYLPGIHFSDKIVASGDLHECAKDANILVFVLPHQFLPRVCANMKGFISPNARAVSFIKGIFFDNDDITLISQFIRKSLNVPVCVVSGANLAKEVAAEKFAEATLGFDTETTLDEVRTLQLLFDTPYFRIGAIRDIAGVELCGALKNIVALAAGFVDGLGMGSNTKAAIIRIGSKEIRHFSHKYFDGVHEATFWESCGFADVVTTCYGGRNSRCAKEFVLSRESFTEIEERLLNGQKLQGPPTCQEIHGFLSSRNDLDDYPLFNQTYKIGFENADPKSIVEIFMNDKLIDIIE